MDFPTSQPDVGLVGGVFVDENPATGQPGSRIPADWGNAVTLELLEVIKAAGLDPAEGDTTQLLQAIRALVPERSAFTRLEGSLVLPANAFGIYGLADGGAPATVTLPSTADLVDDTELFLFADPANTFALQVKVVGGQAVQGPGALMAGSSTAFMLPAGGDWVRLRSEKAQARWVVAGCFASAQIASLQQRATDLEKREGLSAWVRFNGYTGVIYAAKNVSSITKIAAGRWDVVFAIPMNTLAFAAVATAEGLDCGANTYDYTLQKVRVAYFVSDTNEYRDTDNMSVFVVGGL